MGRGGYHHYYKGHYHRYKVGRGGDIPLGVLIVAILVLLVISYLINTAQSDDIRNGETISEDYVITEYLYDEADYFEDRD